MTLSLNVSRKHEMDSNWMSKLHVFIPSILMVWDFHRQDNSKSRNPYIGLCTMLYVLYIWFAIHITTQYNLASRYVLLFHFHLKFHNVHFQIMKLNKMICFFRVCQGKKEMRVKQESLEQRFVPFILTRSRDLVEVCIHFPDNLHKFPFVWYIVSLLFQ